MKDIDKITEYLEDFIDKASLEGIIALDSFWELFDLNDIPVSKNSSVSALQTALQKLCNLVVERDNIILSYASIDALTGAYNRSFFENQMSTITLSAKEENIPLSLILIDIDDFKAINDTHGHAVGDSVLISLVRVIKRVTKERDLVIRFGGDEFLVILFDVDCEHAEEIKDRIYKEIKKRNTYAKFKFSVSLGCASWETGNDLYKKIKEADSKMYEEKNDK